MEHPILPPDVGQFLLDRIDSIAQLEAVLLLRQSPDTWWTCQAVAERLYITETACVPVLEGLCKQGLLLKRTQEAAADYRYRPQTGDLREMVDRVAYYYAKQLVPVSNLVHAKAKRRIEGFAQAFKLSSKE